MTISVSASRVAAAAATALAMTFALTACETGDAGSSTSDDASAATASAAGSGGVEATGGAAKPDEGPKPGEFAAISQCAIESGPWVLNTTATAESVSAFFAAQGAQVVSSSITGVYTAEFGRDGTFTIRTTGIATTTSFLQPDGENIYTDGYLPGEGVTRWSEVSGFDDGSRITFAPWDGGLEWTEDGWSREFTTLDGLPDQNPLWDPSYSTATWALQCAPEQLVLELATDSPHVTLVFAPQG